VFKADRCRVKAPAVRSDEIGLLIVLILRYPRVLIRSCNPDVEWFHCETTVDPESTWVEAWRALEKAYAEGRVNSIGVSNFNVEQLQQLSAVAVTRPHALQNFARIGEIDMDVLAWCRDHGVLFQPYAPNRNLDTVPEPFIGALAAASARLNVSAHAASLRFFLQLGTPLRSVHLYIHTRVVE